MIEKYKKIQLLDYKIIKIISILIVCILAISNTSLGSKFQHQSILIETINQEEYDLVIITPQSFSDELVNLINHKNNHGVKTYLKTTEEIYTQYSGVDEAEQIKYFIKDAVEQDNIKYVLLVGGRKGQTLKWHIPVRYVNNEFHVGDSDFYHKKYISDLYFADLYKQNGQFDTWDSDNDGVFAEWIEPRSQDDHIDLIPDVSLGRLPCRSDKEVNDIVNKIINYENNANGQEWLSDILLIGGDSFPGLGDPIPYEGEVSCEWILNYLDGYNPTRLYTSDGTLSSSDDFISAFNKGNGFVVYHGHGKPSSLHTYMPYNPNSQELIEVFNNKEIQKLSNEDKLPIMVVGCCLTTDFDVSIFNFLAITKNYEKFVNFIDFIESCIKECLSWNLVKKANGGSIAYIGGTSTGYLVPGDSNGNDIPDVAEFGYTTGLCNEFFKIYGETGEKILGEIFKDTLTNIINNHSARTNMGQCKCVQEFILIGDPSLKIGGY